MSVIGKGQTSTRTSLLVLFSVLVLLLFAMALVRPLSPIVSAAPPADPPGNNGTVKVDGIEFDTHPDNQPHVACDFQIDFYGFDGGAEADVLFEAQPPTDPKGEILRDLGLDIGADAASGGTDLDGEFTYDLTDALAGFEPHDVQGYHVKLTITTTNPSQAADVKHKVFWIEPCVTEPTRTRTPTPTPTPTPDEGEEGETPTPTPTPTSTPREGELGGNPTPAGLLPDTATAGREATLVPAALFGLLALLSLGALLSIHLVTASTRR